MKNFRGPLTYGRMCDKEYTRKAAVIRSFFI